MMKGPLSILPRHNPARFNIFIEILGKVAPFIDKYKNG
jgi:hypothetical protein